MSVLGPLDVTPVLARLSAQVPELTTVGGVLEYALALRKPPKACPAAYVVRAIERSAGVQPASMIASNKVTVSFTVCLAFEPDFDLSFTDQDQALTEIETKVREALCGWRIPGVTGTNYAVEFVQSAISGLDEQTIWIKCDFLTGYHQRYPLL